MNDLHDSADKLGDTLERLGERAEDIAEDITEAVAEEVGDQSVLTYILWAALAALTAWALWQNDWRTAFVAALTLVITVAPLVIQRWADFRLPRTLIFLIALFAAATLVLGEVFDFYERFWWWDVAMHSGSAIMFGIFGVILIMIVFKGADVKASPLMVSLFALTFAIAIGAVWEIFEFGMDQTFGTNMQKSGLVDTMADLIVDTIGGIIGAAAGYIYLKRGRQGPVSGLVADMAMENSHRIADDTLDERELQAHSA